MSNRKLREIVNCFTSFAKTFWKVPDKQGHIVPFFLNRAQTYLHERIEEQLKNTGNIRALVLKGRQQGISTYIQARFLYKVVTTKGKKAFILTHQAEATKNLFEKTRNFYDQLPAGLAPRPDSDSAKSLDFQALGSGYKVGTSGNKGVGRSLTIQLFHGSEAAFWENADDHQMGVLQAVGNAPNTEILLESTANGIGNFYYNKWMDAIAGKSEYQAIFIPWYWQDEYARDAKRDESPELSEEEEEIFRNHATNGLTKRHLYWRRSMIAEFSNDRETALEKFHQEYPMTAIDAFRNPVADRFIKAHIVMKARNNRVETSESPLIIGVDPAISDRDALAIIRRKGRKAYGLEKHYNKKPMEIVWLLKGIIERERPTKVFVDWLNMGSGIVDRLHEMGFNMVEGINVARTANDKEKFANIRAEIWSEMRDWLTQEMPVEIPDRDDLMGDLTCLGSKHRTSTGQLLIESKEDLRARSMPSPDAADALALTFSIGQVIQSSGYQINYIPERANGMFM